VNKRRRFRAKRKRAERKAAAHLARVLARGPFAIASNANPQAAYLLSGGRLWVIDPVSALGPIQGIPPVSDRAIP
jgi:hypothetical protein